MTIALEKELAESFNPRVASALKAATAAAPFTSMLGVEVEEQRAGYIRCRIPVTEKLRNGIGLVHGGVLTGLIDHVLSIVVYPHVEVGRWVATLDLKVSYIAPVRDGEIVAEAHVVSLRKRIGTVRIDVKNPKAPGDGGELVAAAMGTVYVKEAPNGK
jgi:acyl-CoA thioesterase